MVVGLLSRFEEDLIVLQRQAAEYGRTVYASLSERCRWSLLRLRADRRSPNALRTVANTLRARQRRALERVR
jgi:hypothetical protein